MNSSNHALTGFGTAHAPGLLGEDAVALLNSPLWSSAVTQLYPRNLREALFWSNWLRTRYGDYTAVVRRAVSYFLGGIDLTGADMDAESIYDYQDRLTNDHMLLSMIEEVGMDLQFNGNVFVSVMRPIKRSLMCPKCGTLRYLSSMTRGTDYDYSAGGGFTSACSKSCGFKGTFKINDTLDLSASRPLSLINWNPLNIDIDYCSLTGRSKITYTPEKQDRNFIDNEAQSVALESLPVSLLDALSKDLSIQFREDNCLHLKTSTDAMNRAYSHGWGLPKYLPSFKYVVLMMLLEKQMESASKDFILPLRLLFPNPQSRGGADPTTGTQFDMSLGHLKQVVTAAMQAQAQRQSSFHMVPMPVGSMQLGGDGKALIPVDVLEYITSRLSDSQCIPQEFNRSSLFVGAGAQPTSLRMFERTWAHDAAQNNILLNWYLDKCSSMLMWPRFKGTVLHPSIMSDPARMQVIAQKVAEGRISETTFLRMFDIDPRVEKRLRLEDTIARVKEQEEINNRLETMGFTNSINRMQTQQSMQEAAQAAQGQPSEGQPPQEGAEAAQGMMVAGGAIIQPPMTGDPLADIRNMASMRPGANPSMEQVQVDAQYAAQILMQTPPGALRNAIFAELRKNPTVHAVAKGILEQLEQQVRQQGLEQVRQSDGE